MYYCIIYHNYKIININNFNIYIYIQPLWSLEYNIDNKIMKQLLDNNIEINWQSYNLKDVINDNICIIYHTDRRTSISKSELFPIPV